MFGGDLGVRIWGLTAPTYALEVTVALEPESLTQFLARLEGEGYIVPQESACGWVDAGEGVPGVRVGRSSDGRIWEAALYLAGSPFLKSAIERRRKARVGMIDVWMIAPEDLILNLLQTGTSKALLQAVEILSVTYPIDPDYLKTWAGELDVNYQLSEVMTRARMFE